jgi:hypothetical protein
LKISLPILLMLLAIGCGKKGPPMPPEPRGPLPPGMVKARQIGRSVVVSFTVPEPRGDKPARQPVRAELIRVAYGPGFEPPANPGVFRRRGEVIDLAEGDPLPSGERRRLVDDTLQDLQGGWVGSTLRYAVRVRDRRGRSSPLVVTRDIVPIASVPAPSRLQAEPTADGVRLVWKGPPSEGPHSYNVYRSALEGPPAEIPLNSQPLDVTEYLDSTVTVGERYLYTVRVALADSPPYREGESSTPLETLAEDRFPPEAPEGLIAVQEASAVRLFWNPNRERDLAGYRVYRSRDGKDWLPIGPDPVEKSDYLDEDVGVGEILAYRVTAIDKADPPNESPLSESVELELLAEPAGGPE